MSKRNTVSVTLLSAFALTIICFLSAAAQKDPQGTASSVKPVRGIDVVVMKNPGNSAARTIKTNEKGEVEFVGLEPGNYSLAIVDNSRQERGGMNTPAAMASQTGDRYAVEINGAVGGPVSREWNIKESKFVTPSDATARATTAPRFEDKINFEIVKGSPAPVLRVSISKQRSNVKTND